jgi:hypothetical protein
MLFEAADRPHLKEYLLAQYSWNEMAYKTINWMAMYLSIWSLNNPEHKCVTKFCFTDAAFWTKRHCLSTPKLPLSGVTSSMATACPNGPGSKTTTHRQNNLTQNTTTACHGPPKSLNTFCTPSRHYEISAIPIFTKPLSPKGEATK